MSSEAAVGASGVNSKANIRSSVRKVKQPVSYAEPSTKSKLRRGDVLFPKMESSDKVGTSPGGGLQMTSTAELDQIIGQIASLPLLASSSSQPQPSSETCDVSFFRFPHTMTAHGAVRSSFSRTKELRSFSKSTRKDCIFVCGLT